jgi:superoxide reductase
MPRIFSQVDKDTLEKEIQRDYFDRHSPIIICDDNGVEGEKFKVKVQLGSEYKHPDDADHFICYIQLWNREQLLSELKMFPGAMGNKPSHVEVDFYIIPKVSMNLTAMSYCTKHGLWQSQSREVKVDHPNLDCSK